MAQAESPPDVQAAAAKALPDLAQYTAEQALLGAIIANNQTHVVTATTRANDLDHGEIS